MLRPRHLAAIAAVCFCAGIAQADEPDDAGDQPDQSALPTTVDALVEVAVRLSPDLARAKQDRAVAAGQAGAAARDQSWVVRMTTNYQRSLVGDRGEIAPFGVVATDTIRGTVGAGRRLPTGGTVDLELGLSHTVSDLNIPPGLVPTMNSPGTSSMDIGQLTQIQSTGRLTLTQPLVRGLGSDVALADQHKTELAASQAALKARLDAETMIRDVVTGYWELAYASFELDTRSEALELARAQDKVTRAELRAGTTSQNALDAVSYEIFSRQEARLTAQLNVEQKSLELGRKAGIVLDRRHAVFQPGEPFQIGQDDKEHGYDVETALARARRTNRDLAINELGRKIASIDVGVASNSMLPKVDVSVSGALIGGGATTSAAVDGLTRADGYEVTAGLSVSFEISGAARAQHDAAIATKRRVDLDRATLERQLEIEVVRAVHAVTGARARVASSDKAIEVAERNVRAEQVAFQVGKVTNFTVMQRQGELIDARLRRGRAIADYHIAVAQLEFLSGTLLDHYGVRVLPQLER